MARKASRLAEAATKRIIHQGQRCATCDTTWGKLVDELLEDMLEGRCPVLPIEAIWRALKEDFDYPFTSGALKGHLRTHRADAWEKVQARR